MRRKQPGAPSKLTVAQWSEARALYEAGATFREVAEKFGMVHGSIQKKAAADGWTQDAEEAIRRRTREKVARVPIQADPAKKNEAIEEEAARRVAILERHATEWEQVKRLQVTAILLHDASVGDTLKTDEKGVVTVVKEGKLDEKRATEAFNLAKFAKINSEITAIRHAGERKAIGMDTPEEDPRAVRVIVERKAGGRAEA